MYSQCMLGVSKLIVPPWVVIPHFLSSCLIPHRKLSFGLWGYSEFKQITVFAEAAVECCICVSPCLPPIHWPAHCHTFFICYVCHLDGAFYSPTLEVQRFLQVPYLVLGTVLSSLKLHSNSWDGQPRLKGFLSMIESELSQSILSIGSSLRVSCFSSCNRMPMSLNGHWTAVLAMLLAVLTFVYTWVCCLKR